jgi:catechol 2,3-dioxygenase-like lactoylglutathione lyase family enzyme
MEPAGIATLMIFVDRPDEAARFWGGVLGAPPPDDDPQLVPAAGLQLFFHAADPARNPQGGTVAYLAVADFDGAREELLSAGCGPHRGPLALADGRRICQVRDPFGTVWGLEQVNG